MPTLNHRTLVAFFAGVTLTIAATFAFQAWRADAWPGETDTTFVPITPCRLLDTRPQTEYNVGPRSTPIGADSPVTFTAWDSGDDDSKCEIPNAATAISTNTTVMNPTHNSFLKLYPADAALPGTSNLNYVAGQAATPNAVTIPLSPTGMFNMYNRFGSVDVIVDINGYYTKTSLQDIDFWIGDLYLAQPFVETAFGRPNMGSPTSPVQVSVTVTAPHDGQVTVTSTASFFSWDPNGGELAECVIVESTNAAILPHPSQPSYQVLQAPSGQPIAGSLSGTRAFDITEGSTVDYVLTCAFYPAVGLPNVEANLTAIFTPTY
jgi:hypothetical protein